MCAQAILLQRWLQSSCRKGVTSTCHANPDLPVGILAEDAHGSRWRALQRLLPREDLVLLCDADALVDPRV
jgi:hypothetical protein